MIDEAIIDRAARALVRAAGEQSQVILFGSHACGQGNPQSDPDSS